MQAPKYKWIEIVEELFHTGYRIAVMQSKHGWLLAAKKSEALEIIQKFIIHEYPFGPTTCFIADGFIDGARRHFIHSSQKVKSIDTIVNVYEHPRRHGNFAVLSFNENVVYRFPLVSVMFVAHDLFEMDYAAMRETMKPLAEELARVVFSPKLFTS